MSETSKEIVYEEWVRAANELVRDIDGGTSVSAPWNYRTPAEIDRQTRGRQPVNKWKVTRDVNRVIVSYKPGYNQSGKYYSRYVSRKGTPRSAFATRSIYKTEIEPLLLPEVRDSLLDRLGEKLTEYFRIQFRAEVDKYDDLEFKISG